MTDQIARAGIQHAALPARSAGHSMVVRCLEAQASAHPRHPWQRMLGISPLTSDARRWYFSAVAAIEVGAELDSLGQPWFVVHSVPTGWGDVDHLVTGPKGMFALTTQHHDVKLGFIGGRAFNAGHITLDDTVTSEDQASRVVELVADAIGTTLPVTPVIVVAGADSIRPGRWAHAVEIVTAKDVVAWMQNRPLAYTDAAAAHLASVAANDRTWPHPEAPRASEQQAFDELRTEVVWSKRRARRWQLAATAALVVALGILLATTFTTIIGAMSA